MARIVQLRPKRVMKTGQNDKTSIVQARKCTRVLGKTEKTPMLKKDQKIDAFKLHRFQTHNSTDYENSFLSS